MRISDQEANRLLVLKTIRREEPVARTELVKLTGLSNGTITEVVADLIRRGFLLEAKAPAAGRGRPRLHLILNPEAAHVLGAFVLPDGALSVEVSNLRGDRLLGRTFPLGRAPTIEAFAENIAEALEETIRTSPLHSAHIHSVGVALAATVDSERGVVHVLQTYPAQPAPFAEIIERRLRVPVTIDNTVNVMARAEHWFGEDRRVDDFSLFVVGLGLGAAAYVGGMLHAGANGMSTEFQHVKLAIDEGPVCLCGARGCLAALASGHGVVQRVCEGRGRSAPRLKEAASLLPVFAREAQAGDPLAREAFAYAGRLIGIAVANHINAALPARIIVLALHPEMADLIVAPFYSAVHENTFPAFRGRTAIQFKVAPEVRYSLGAAAIVLERLYRVGGEQQRPGAGSMPIQDQQ